MIDSPFSVIRIESVSYIKRFFTYLPTWATEFHRKTQAGTCKLRRVFSPVPGPFSQKNITTVGPWLSSDLCHSSICEIRDWSISKFHSHFAAVNTICIVKAVVKVQCRKKRHILHRFCTKTAPFFQKLRQNSEFRACFSSFQHSLIFAKTLWMLYIQTTNLFQQHVKMFALTDVKTVTFCPGYHAEYRNKKQKTNSRQAFKPEGRALPGAYFLWANRADTLIRSRRNRCIDSRSAPMGDPDTSFSRGLVQRNRRST